MGTKENALFSCFNLYDQVTETCDVDLPITHRDPGARSLSLHIGGEDPRVCLRVVPFYDIVATRSVFTTLKTTIIGQMTHICLCIFKAHCYRNVSCKFKMSWHQKLILWKLKIYMTVNKKLKT